MSKSIRSVLETLVAGIEACVENNKVDIKQESVEVDQAIKDIEKDYISKEKVLQIIDEARPKETTYPPVLVYVDIVKKAQKGGGYDDMFDAGFDQCADQFQSNLREALGL